MSSTTGFNPTADDSTTKRTARSGSRTPPPRIRIGDPIPMADGFTPTEAGRGCPMKILGGPLITMADGQAK
jgi:hypothetical protein